MLYLYLACGWLCECSCVFVCMYETIAKPSGGPAFSISWAHLVESIHAVIKCFESMFWIIFSNCLRAIKLPPTNLTLKMRKSESASKDAAGKDSKYFLPMTSALTIQKLFVPRFASAKQQTLLGIWARHIYALSICTSRYMNVGPTIEWSHPLRFFWMPLVDNGGGCLC